MGLWAIMSRAWRKLEVNASVPGSPGGCKIRGYGKYLQKYFTGFRMCLEVKNVSTSHLVYEKDNGKVA